MSGKKSPYQRGTRNKRAKGERRHRQRQNGELFSRLANFEKRPLRPRIQTALKKKRVREERKKGSERRGVYRIKATSALGCLKNTMPPRKSSTKGMSEIKGGKENPKGGEERMGRVSLNENGFLVCPRGLIILTLPWGAEALEHAVSGVTLSPERSDWLGGLLPPVRVDKIGETKMKTRRLVGILHRVGGGQ